METGDLAIRAVTRDFTRRVINPHVKKFDTQPQAGFPSEAIAEAQQIGLTIVTAPEEWVALIAFSRQELSLRS